MLAEIIELQKRAQDDSSSGGGAAIGALGLGLGIGGVGYGFLQRRKATQLGEQLGQTTKQLEEAQKNISKLIEEKSALGQQLQTLRQEKSVLGQRLRTLQQEKEQLLRQKFDLLKQRKQLSKELQTAQTKAQRMMAARNLLEKQKLGLQTQLQKTREAFETATEFAGHWAEKTKSLEKELGRYKFKAGEAAKRFLERTATQTPKAKGIASAARQAKSVLSQTAQKLLKFFKR